MLGQENLLVYIKIISVFLHLVKHLRTPVILKKMQKDLFYIFGHYYVLDKFI